MSPLTSLKIDYEAAERAVEATKLSTDIVGAKAFALYGIYSKAHHPWEQII